MFKAQVKGKEYTQENLDEYFEDVKKWRPKSSSRHGSWSPRVPKFKADPMSALERKWLGKYVKLRHQPGLVGGTGQVVGLAPGPHHFWVYVSGWGFYNVHESSLTEVKACCPHPKCPGRSLCCCDEERRTLHTTTTTDRRAS